MIKNDNLIARYHSGNQRRRRQLMESDKKPEKMSRYGKPKIEYPYRHEGLNIEAANCQVWEWNSRWIQENLVRQKHIFGSILRRGMCDIVIYSDVYQLLLWGIG